MPSVMVQPNRSAAVPGDLLAALEPAEVPEAQAPVRACHRYLVQQRLKRPGAWWTPDNAEAMLALRIARANGHWSAYWNDELKHVA